MMPYIFTLLMVIFLSGCSVKYTNDSRTPSSKKENIQKLSHAIIELDTAIDEKEALSIATIAYEYPLELANRYELVSPPLFHNTLINMNLKQRGFCYHFAQDLLRELKKQNMKTIHLRWVTHKKNDYWEHNAVLITAKNQFYQEGIILDAWRNSGKLFWSHLKKDTKYNWVFDQQKSRIYGN